MNAYRRRYINALKKAATINRYQKKGYHVFFDGSPTQGRFELDDKQLLFRTTPHTSYIFFENDKEWDHGYWTPINKWDAAFHARFAVFNPTSKVF